MVQPALILQCTVNSCTDLVPWHRRFAVASRKDCSRRTWNGEASELCCRTCGVNTGRFHGPACDQNFSDGSESSPGGAAYAAVAAAAGQMMHGGSLTSSEAPLTAALLTRVPSPQIRIIFQRKRGGVFGCLCGPKPRKQDPVPGGIENQDTVPNRFYIGDLPSQCSTDMLGSRFSEYGSIPIESVLINTGRRRGYITFDGPTPLRQQFLRFAYQEGS